MRRTLSSKSSDHSAGPSESGVLAGGGEVGAMGEERWCVCAFGDMAPLEGFLHRGDDLSSSKRKTRHPHVIA